ncbi:hypothetical protein J3459_017353 [Metarhizium acridum]|uniref:Hydroxynaphthalene reductase-like protein Arp2 n=1 Tax=Metarhizium acridum (strain CQMa 102) TaxID=655827 RepID=E9EDR9_METAQ|nr:short chain dehydrogenase/reductase [Metarhizium acridum CQMa 102]EFY85934.1 short chain dehydrogenase/reductase [Metarhizium acridum CQMa 102]KAG8410148.1 hypothetical protein J3459_017353 [Metarhizium acridum]KAG8418474.1 hypothetical protein J3458_005885 [Metarhizium acridum]
MSNRYDSHTLFRVDNLVAVITGGGSGIGRIIAHALVANGAKRVYILGRREASLETTKSTSSHPENITPVVCDVTSKESLRAAADKVRQDCGYCDVVFANSGVSTADASQYLGRQEIDIKALQEGLWQHSMEHFTQSFHVNVTGVFYTTVAFLDLLDEGNKRDAVPQKSQVVVVTSMGGFSRRPKASFAYGPSKAAAGHLAKQLATRLAPYKIRVNNLAPGFYPSEMTENIAFMKETDEPRREGSLANSFVPLERVGSEEDMAGAVLFLASRAGSYVDGNVLLTDGGRASIVPCTY